MAKENSFDIVSILNVQEVDNAVNQTRKEAATRYDLKSTATEIGFDRQQRKVTIITSNEFALRSVVDVLESKLVKRQISLKALSFGRVEPATGGRVRQVVNLIHGISSEKAREINKFIKDAKLKVNVQIEGDKLRVSARSIDLLQEVISMVKQADFNIPLQFVNYR